jgi:hypothetical protein
VDSAQIDALAEVVEAIVASGQAPTATPQSRADGRQYFTMHPQIADLLEQRLAQSQ